MPAAARVPQEALDREFDLVHRVRWLTSPLRQPAFPVCRPCQIVWHTLILSSQHVHAVN
jgi:hypothetical protein